MRKKTIICLLTGTIIIAGSMFHSLSVKASYPMVNQYTSLSNTGNHPVIRADIIETKYRMCRGKQQYRRWNKTRNRWVDPEWIDM